MHPPPPPRPARVAFRETSHSSRHQGPQSSSSLPGTRPGTPRTTYHQTDTQPSCQHSAGAGDRETKLRRWYPTSLLVPPHRVSQSASQSPTHDRQTRPAGRLVGMPSLSKAGRHTMEILKFTRSMWKKESRMYVSSNLIPISSLFRGKTRDHPLGGTITTRQERGTKHVVSAIGKSDMHPMLLIGTLLPACTISLLLIILPWDSSSSRPI